MHSLEMGGMSGRLHRARRPAFTQNSPRMARVSHHRGPSQVHWGLGSKRKTGPLAAAGPASSMAPELKQAVEEFLDKHKIVLFMKGTRQFPQCGFSNTCVQILNVMGVPYETVNILEDDSLRSGMKEFSQWPTFPQVYVDSEFVGGCDIMIEAYQDGSLKEMLDVAVNS